MNRRKSITLATLAVLIGSFLAAKVTQPWRWKGSLVAACEGADRIVVDLDTLPPDVPTSGDARKAEQFDIMGADNVGAFVDAIALETNWWNDACRCYGEMRFDVFRGAERLAAVTIHHDRFLRWQDGTWWGDGNLSNERQRRVGQWLGSNGCPTGKEIREMALRDIRDGQRLESEP